MTSVPTAVHDEQHIEAQAQPPITMFGPDFPFAYDDYLAHPAGLGAVPPTEHGTEVAVVGGGLSGLVTAYELMRMGLRPVLYEADRIGGRLRTVTFDGCDPGLTAEMGAMRFPPSSTAFQHYVDLVGLETRPFPNPLAPVTPSTVVDLKGESHYATSVDDLPEVFHQVMRAWNTCLEDGADFSAMQRALRTRDVPAIRAIWSPLVEKLDNQTFYGFLCDSPAFRSFRHREIFGQVGFGTGGWDTDFPNSILEILRVVYTGADDDHRGIVGGSRQLPCGCGNTSRTSCCTGRAARRCVRCTAASHGPRSPRCTAPRATGSPSPIRPATSAATGRWSSPRRAGCCCPRSPATTRSSRSTTGPPSSGPTTWSPASSSCRSTARSGGTRTRGPAGT